MKGFEASCQQIPQCPYNKDDPYHTAFIDYWRNGLDYGFVALDESQALFVKLGLIN